MATETRPATYVDRADRYRVRRWLMCPPEHFEVSYRINPWMRPPAGSRDRALEQWQRLVEVLVSLGHQVELADPVADAPDMVFAANAGVVVDHKVLAANFRHPERRVEEEPYRDWFRSQGFAEVRRSRHHSEGEGDLLMAGSTILAGYGFRTERGAHDEAAALFGREVVSLELTDPRFYHLDLALCVLDDDLIAYHPGALAPAGRDELHRRFPDAIVVSEAEARAFSLNAVSDGYHVVYPAGSAAFGERLRERGFEPVPVALPELALAGGSAKCCVLELRGGGREWA